MMRMAWVLLACVLAGCAGGPQRSEVWTSETLLGSDLVQSGVHFAGVLFSDQVDPELQRAEMVFSTRTLEAIRQARPDLEFRGAEELARTLGAASLDSVHSRYRDFGRLDAPTMRALSRAGSRCRYVLFARVEVDATATGGAFRGYAARVVQMGFDLYAVQSGQLVSTMRIRNDEVSPLSIRRSDAVPAEDAFDQVRQNRVWASDGESGTPRLEEMVPEMAQDFVRRLPRVKSPH